MNTYPEMQKLKQLLQAKHVTLEDAAKRVGVSREWLSKILNSQFPPSVKLAVALAAAVDEEITAAEILRLPNGSKQKSL